MDQTPGFSEVAFGRPPSKRDGWVCWNQGFQAYKWFSASDSSSELLNIKCVRVDQSVMGADYRTWAGWFKLAQKLATFEIP